MNGPEHYAEAETLLRESRGGIRTPQTAASEATRANTLAAAQVHATLALAAATIDTARARTVGYVSQAEALLEKWPS
jgi:hypothetical protein